jgi:conjugative transfer signal peptidase TraF
MTKASIVGPCKQARAVSVSRLARPIVVCVTTLMAVFGLCACVGLRVNSTGSLPLGIYIVSTAADANLVEFCPSEPYSQLSVVRGYRNPGICPDGDDPLLKPVIAKPGDTVVFSDFGLQVNGVLLRNTAPRSRDSLGRPLPHFPFGTYQVRLDNVWVASSYHPLSFDSRYFGPIPTAAIRNRLKALLTL